MGRYVLLSLLSLMLTAGATAQTAPHNDKAVDLAQVGAGKMFLNCTGNEAGPIVILEAGSGDSSEVWAVVQKQVERFARVCSYDRLGVGKSDKPATAHTADEVVDDLHQLLHEARVPPPYVMVGHSIGGIFVRKYAAKYHEEVIGLGFVDSAHEEQFARASQISPEWAQRIRAKFSAEDQRAGGFLPANGRLEWHFNGHWW